MSLTTYSYTPTFKTGEFHHAVLSIYGTTHTLYLDGSAVLTTSVATDILATLTNVTQSVIGANPGFNQAFNGIIGDVRVYNQVITAKQVSNLYLNRNLIAHYPFDNSVNMLTPNYATLQYDATITGSANLTTGFIGTSQLQLTNTIGGTASQYIIASPGNSTNPWYLNSTTGLTISCWVNLDSTANTNNIMRIFDIPFVAGSKGLGVDISGTNAIYSRLTPIPPINLISITAYNLMINTGTTYSSSTKKYDGTRLQAGAYGLKLLVYKWKNKPVIQLTKDGSITQDFYAPNDGTTNLTTGPDGTGTGIVAWLGVYIGYVTIWYDQTGNGNHATGSTVSITTPLYNKYPYIDTTSNSYYVVEFGDYGFFTLLASSYPTGTNSYSYVFKHGRLGGDSVAVYYGGTSNNTDSTGGLFTANGVFRVVNQTALNDAWGATNYGVTLVGAPGYLNANVAMTYNNTGVNSSWIGRAIYINNSLYISPDTLGNSRNQSGNVCYLGYSGSGNAGTYGTYKSTMPYFYWLPYQLSKSDIALLHNII